MLVRIIIGLFAMSVSAAALGAPCAGFVDVDGSNATYCPAVTYIKNKGITVGCTDATHYCPNASVTRLQMALFLQRAGRGDPSNTLGDETNAIGGGTQNIATGGWATVGGGLANWSKGYGSTVAGGLGNTASGDGSFAAGSGAYAPYIGEFVWADQGGGFFDPGDSSHNQNGLWWADATNTFNARAVGGVMLVTSVNGSGYPFTGVSVSPGSGTWTSHSDRKVKENFAPVDGRFVLQKVARLPISSWNYIAEGAKVRHLGPVSQDFFAAFGLGTNDHGIAVVDADGVSLAAIQGLYSELKDRDAMIAEQRREIANEQREIAGLRERVEQVESLRAELAALRNAIAAAMKGVTVASQINATAP